MARSHGRHVRRWALLATLVLGACRDPQPLRIGLVTGLTGRHYDLGISCRSGASLAVDHINRSGGIGGRLLELLVRDDGQDADLARKAFEDLLGAGVVAVVGNSTSSMTAVTLELANRERLLVISPTATASALRGLDDWLFTLHGSTSDQGRALAEFLDRAGRGRRVTALFDLSNRAYAESWLSDFRAEHEARGGTVRAVPFTSGASPPLSAVAAAALEEPTAGVLLLANALDTATLCQQIRKRSRAVPIYGTEWGFTQDVIAHGASAIEGVVVIQMVDMDDPSPDFVRFKQAYQERFHRAADYPAALSYEAILVLAEALRRDPTRAGVRDALIATRAFRGLQGEIRFDRFGDVQRRNRLFTIREGRTSVIE